MDRKRRSENKIVAGAGMSLGSLVAISLVILGHQVLQPAGITPQLHRTAALLTSQPLGKLGFYLALVGITFTIGGAAVETCLAGAYNIFQYFKFNWGKSKKPEETPRFNAAWIIIFLLAFCVMLFGIDSIDLVDYAVIFPVLAFPFIYFPILLAASDKSLMGEHAVGLHAKTVDWIYFAIVVVVAISAVPLMIFSHMGKL